ncbi:Uncharacterized protein Anas_02879 [Armadillidium nasatum]|uniref:FAS1 domain-containing protein n=1 Tax=Armadillidium nasatum TaxID=96803 RepID=A0A5N5TIS7_9CRUS|nr:Uncharacterized protein Anas_02879 [Armadillidium nasatum]
MECPYTLLVPTNEAFSLLSPTFLAAVRSDPSEIKGINSRSHPARKDVTRLISVMGHLWSHFSETKLYFSVNRRGVSINGAYVSVADIQASNGIVHIIDRVLVHEGDRGFGTHIVLGEVRFPSLLRSDIARTLNGKLLWLTSGSGGYQVNGTMVLQKDIKVSNGVVHVLHNMLMPPDAERITYPIIEKNHHFRNVIDTISANGLKAFERLIDHVALRAILVLDGPFTIFAPTDTAFNSLDPRLIGTLTSDKELLKDIILQHVVRGRVRENELALGWEGFALNGQNLYSSLLGHDITISGSRVIIPNIDSQNGIIHVVDRVILPPRAKNPSVNGARIINPGIRTENGVFNIVDKVLLPPSGTVADLITSNHDRTKIPNIWDRYSLLNPLKNTTRPDLSLFSPTSDAFSRNPYLNPPLVGPRGTEDLLHRHLLYGLNRPCYTPKICNKDYLFADGTKTSPPRKREEKGERKAPPPK